MKFLKLATVGGLAIVLSACGDDDDAVATTPATASSATTPTATETEAATATEAEAETAAETGAPADAADFNDADVAFAQGMIPHHEQAVEMADIALDPAADASESVRDLATRIKAAQDPEIELMTGWLAAWGQPVSMDDMDDMDDMDGMMTSDEMDALGALSGPEFDTMWLEMMIRHHEGAIDMAESEQETGADPDAIALATAIIEAQQAEIDEMQAALDAG